MALKTSFAISLSDFEEDRRSAWLPDAAGEFDIEQSLSTETITDFWTESFRVPKPDGTSMWATHLPFDVQVALHRAVEPDADPGSSLTLS